MFLIEKSTILRMIQYYYYFCACFIVLLFCYIAVDSFAASSSKNPSSSSSSHNSNHNQLTLPIQQQQQQYHHHSTAGDGTTTTTTAPSSANTVGEIIEETGFYQSIRLTDEPVIVRKQSQYQTIEVRRSPYYGKVLLLDGVMQLTERDADSYNEMMAHIPMFQHINPKRVLIIGGGDGYVLSEVLKHKSVQHIDHVDLDADVINVCKEYFAWGRNGWLDNRVHLHIADGAQFVQDAKSNYYDVIIQDSSDPWTWGIHGERIILPSSVLYSSNHFQNIHRILNPTGIFVLQAESLQIPSDLNGAREWRQLALNSGFQSAKYASIMISSYPTGQIGLLLCEKDSTSSSTIQQIHERYNRDIIDSGKSTSYYHPALQLAAFVLPKWAEKHIYDDIVDSSPSCLSEGS